MKEKNMTCIACPMGCKLHVCQTENGFEVDGQTCKAGENYAKQEMTDPRRVLTSSVRVKNGFLELVPVKTAKPVPKGCLFDVIKEIDKLEIQAPVKRGDVIVANILNTGIDIIATRDLPAVQA